MYIRGIFRHAVKLCKATFDKTPERFNSSSQPVGNSLSYFKVNSIDGLGKKPVNWAVLVAMKSSENTE